MYRKIERTLKEWKETQGRKPLLITGARQTGKSYVMEKFAREEFDSVISVDFEKNPNIRRVFDGDLAPDVVIAQLEAISGVSFVKGKTLIIFDEIQACPRAITALKYFCDSAEDFFVIGAGSLLGVAIKREGFSFPVGKVRTERLFPMDYEEFLIALGKDILLEHCRTSFLERTLLSSALHEELLSIYRMYLVIGGMPEVVKTFIDQESYVKAGEVQEEIISDYRADIAKYAENSQKVLSHRAFDTIPAQLAKENRKFQYNLIRKGATSSLFGKSLEWLCDAGLTLRCSKVSAPDIPLKAYEDLSSFKLYLLDPGLLVRLSGLPCEIILNQIGERFIGGLTENYVAATLASAGMPLYYWESSGRAEIDFLMQHGTDVVPVEVKAGEHVRSRSLSVYRNTYNPSLSIRLSTRNFGFEDGLFSVPLYAAWLLSSKE